MNWLTVLDKTEFESSSGLTPQFSSFYRLFKKEFKELLLTHNVNPVDIIINRGHFYIYGFFKMLNGKIFYFNLGDVRFWKNHMMVRTAKDFKDYTGGSNINLSLVSDGCFLEDLERAIGV